MRLAPECRACLLSRVVAEAEYASSDAETVALALRRCTELYDSRADEPVGASVIAGAVHRCCYAVIGSADPYADLKVQDNAVAAGVAEAMRDATLIIAKGLANYESLTEYAGLPPVAYLMTVKCEPVARHVGAKKGDLIAVLRQQ